MSGNLGFSFSFNSSGPSFCCLLGIFLQLSFFESISCNLEFTDTGSVVGLPTCPWVFEKILINEHFLKTEREIKFWRFSPTPQILCFSFQFNPFKAFFLLHRWTRAFYRAASRPGDCPVGDRGAWLCRTSRPLQGGTGRTWDQRAALQGDEWPAGGQRPNTPGEWHLDPVTEAILRNLQCLFLRGVGGLSWGSGQSRNNWVFKLTGWHLMACTQSWSLSSLLHVDKALEWRLTGWTPFLLIPLMTQGRRRWWREPLGAPRPLPALRRASSELWGPQTPLPPS